MPELREVHIDNLSSESGARVVYFWSPGSGPCRTFEPQLVDFLGRLGIGDVVLKVNIVGFEDSAREFGVLGVPALAFVVDGEPQEWLFGRLSGEFVFETLSRWKGLLGS